LRFRLLGSRFGLSSVSLRLLIRRQPDIIANALTLRAKLIARPASP